MVAGLALSGCCGPCLTPCNPFAGPTSSPPPLAVGTVSWLEEGQTAAQIREHFGDPERTFTRYCNLEVTYKALEYRLAGGRSLLLTFSHDGRLVSALTLAGPGQQQIVLGVDPCQRTNRRRAVGSAGVDR